MYLQGNNGDERNCTLVSIANLTGKKYAEVRSVADQCHAYIQGRGTYVHKIPDILALLGIHSTIKKPRRGAEKLTGIVTFFRSGVRRFNGHSVAMIQGKILETDNIWYSLDVYRRSYKYHINNVHVIGDDDIDWSIIPDSRKGHFHIPRKITCNLCSSNSHKTDDCPLASIWKG